MNSPISAWVADTRYERGRRNEQADFGIPGVRPSSGAAPFQGGRCSYPNPQSYGTKPYDFALMILPCSLLTDDLHQHPLAPVAIELSIKDLLPGTEIEFALGNGHHHFASHHLALQMRIGVVLAGAVVAIFARRFMRGQAF